MDMFLSTMNRSNKHACNKCKTQRLEIATSLSQSKVRQDIKGIHKLMLSSETCLKMSLRSKSEMLLLLLERFCLARLKSIMTEPQKGLPTYNTKTLLMRSMLSKR
jgi:hypothetical protein